MHVKISSPHGLGGSTDVELDGKKARWLTGVKFEVSADGFARAELKTLVPNFEYDGQADVRIDAETAELLFKLGWTPPKEDADGNL